MRRRCSPGWGGWYGRRELARCVGIFRGSGGSVSRDRCSYGCDVHSRLRAGLRRVRRRLVLEHGWRWW